MTAAMRAPLDGYVPPEIVSSVFHSATVSNNLAILVAESRGGTTRLSWGNQGAVHLLGYGLEDLRTLSVQQLFPSLRGGELGLLLRRERSAQMTVPVRSANGALIEAVVSATPSPGGLMWTLRVSSASDNAQERALRATADAHERRFATLTERSPVPTLLSEQGMRLAHVNDAFCSLVGRQAEELLGTGWMAAVHPDDLAVVIEQAALVLGGEDGEGEAQPGWSASTAPSGRRSSASRTCSPPAWGRASSAPSRTSPSGWPSRPGWPTRPTTTR